MHRQKHAVQYLYIFTNYPVKTLNILNILTTTNTVVAIPVQILKFDYYMSLHLTTLCISSAFTFNHQNNKGVD